MPNPHTPLLLNDLIPCQSPIHTLTNDFSRWLNQAVMLVAACWPRSKSLARPVVLIDRGLAVVSPGGCKVLKF